MRLPMLLQRSFMHMWQCIMPQQSISYAKRTSPWNVLHGLPRINGDLRPAIDGQPYIKIIAQVVPTPFSRQGPTALP